MAYDRAYVLKWIKDNPWTYGDENNPMDALVYAVGDSAANPTEQYKNWPHFYNVPGVGMVQYDPSNGRIFVTDNPFGMAYHDQETVTELQGKALTPTTIKTEQGGWLDQLGPAVPWIAAAVAIYATGGAAGWWAAAGEGGGADLLATEALLTEGGGEAATWAAADYAAADAAGGLVAEFGTAGAYDAAMAAAAASTATATGAATGASSLGQVVSAVKSAAGIGSAAGTIANLFHGSKTTTPIYSNQPAVDWTGTAIPPGQPGGTGSFGVSGSVMLIAAAALLGLLLSKGKKR